MDIVISFVDCKDKVWMKSYLKTIHNQSQLFPYYQFYNHNTIKYVVRKLEKLTKLKLLYYLHNKVEEDYFVIRKEVNND